MDIVWGCSRNPVAKSALIEWTSRQIWPGTSKTLPDGVCMAVVEGDEVAGCVVFHDWDADAGTIEMSAAAGNRRWLTRPALKAMFEYPFIQLGLQMVVARVSAASRQKHLHRIFTAYGFKSQKIPRLFGRHEDGIVFTLTDDDWRNSKFNRQQEATSG